MESELLKCCDTCRWYNREFSGRCHRRSPGENGWPLVLMEYYCGDYEQGQFVPVSCSQVFEARKAAKQQDCERPT